MWWAHGMGTPALVTTSPINTPRDQAGVLGLASTETIYGARRLLTQSRNGLRFSGGWWLDECQWKGIEADIFGLAEKSETAVFASGGDPIIARPFFNVLTNQEDSNLVAYPGFVSGTLTIGSSTELLSVAPRFRLNVYSEDYGDAPVNAAAWGQGFRIDFLAGYRYARLRESLTFRERQVTTLTSANIASSLDSVDAFGTENTFNGGEIGLVWSGYRGPWSMDVMGRLALGNNRRTVQIDGSTVRTTAGVSVPDTGGMLALPSNIGLYRDDKFAMIPEFDVTVGYALTARLRATFGYTFIFWPDVARPGDQIDLRINPNLFPPANNVGPRNPAFAMRDTGYWAQGLNLGLDYRW